MKPFFPPNLERKGRIVRGVGGAAFLVGGICAWPSSRWLGIVLVAYGGFALFQAFRGWCILRACGIKTKL
jgi:hypothetical protein